MIERHITFNVLPGKAEEFVQFITLDYRPRAMEMPGFIECSLLQESENTDRYQVVFRWEQAEDAVAWRVSEVHQALQPALEVLHGGMDITAYIKVA